MKAWAISSPLFGPAWLTFSRFPLLLLVYHQQEVHERQHCCRGIGGLLVSEFLASQALPHGLGVIPARIGSNVLSFPRHVAPFAAHVPHVSLVSPPGCRCSPL